jgi:CheY-like chemotaxis protein
MVVDDNADAAQSLAMLLEAEGHNVCVEYTAQSALERARVEAPRALLLDIGLPGMDGYELARRLRALPQTAGALLIALTGYGQDQDRERSKAAGFDHHLVKPADTKKLSALLAELDGSNSLALPRAGRS